MMPRQVPPAYSPVSLRAIAAALPSLVHPSRAPLHDVATRLAHEYGAREVVLTGSGTAALVLALRAAVPAGGTVALPGYGCIDLVAAALRTGVGVRLYDVEPHSLSPDLDSLHQILLAGVDAVVVAHLYGYAADVAAVSELATRFGVCIIEDAAQGAGGTLHGRPLGAYGPLTVLSFGRGKGMTGGGGGALLALTDTAAAQVRAHHPPPWMPRRGFRNVVVAGAQLALSSPTLYGIPASIPALRLGEMVYRPAGEPGVMPAACAVLVRHALAAACIELAIRRVRASALLELARGAGLRYVAPIHGSNPGFLRFPLLARYRRAPAPRLGVLRGYPLALADMAELQPVLIRPQQPARGAAELRDQLLTLPTHSRLRGADVEQLCEWMLGSTSSDAARPPSTWHQPIMERSPVSDSHG